MRTKAELEEMRQLAVSLGSNVGHTVGDMCNRLMYRNGESWADTRHDLHRAASIVEREIDQLKGMVRVLMEQKPANAEVSDGGPLTHESPAAQSRRSLH